MNLPTLPSDNLYKFKAFFGLALILFSVYIPATQFQTAWEKTFDINVEMANIDAEIAIIEKNKNHLLSDLAFYKKNTKMIQLV